ncbi:MAG: hypothetical protein VX833_09475 [Actinomycetota bacterium]|nr:hypothetical protein [Actinomycetota bacterium]
MGIRLRQVAFVAEDLPPVEAAIEEHLGLSLCFRDPGVEVFGLRNALYPVGEQLLEVVSPIQPGTTAGRLLEKRGGDGGYMVIFQVEDLAPFRQRVDDGGVRVVFEAVAEGVVGLHLHPSDIGGAIVSVDQSDEWATWPWAGPGWRDHICTAVVQAISAVEIQAEDPEAMASRWSEVLGCPAEGTAIVLDEGEIRFVEVADGRGEGVSAVEFAATQTGELEISGVRILLAPQAG